MYGAKMDEATELKLLEEMLLVGKDDGIHLDDVEVSTIGTLQFHFHSYQLFHFQFSFSILMISLCPALALASSFSRGG
jgi:hypothetical protein